MDAKKQHKYNRIFYLKDKYSPTKLAQGEVLSKESISRIRSEHYTYRKKAVVDDVLNQIRNPERVRDEVYNIADYVNFHDLCTRCTSEQVVSVIVLYCMRSHSDVLKEERTALWDRYGLSWKVYGRVVANILRRYREDRLLSFNQN